MAHRRMFSKAIVGSARFLKMPVDSQSLYFHLGMATDDDGVVEAWSVLRETGSAEDNLRVLASKGFVKVLNEDLVSYIMDWNEHNELRADRLVPSQYRELLIQMLPEVRLVEPRRRADLKPRLPELSGRPLDNQWTAQERLGEVRLDDISASRIEIVSEKDEDKPKRESKAKYPNHLEVFALWGNYPRSWLNNTQKQAAENLYEEHGIEEIKNALGWVRDLKDREFCPVITSPHDLDSKWDKFERFVDKSEV